MNIQPVKYNQSLQIGETYTRQFTLTYDGAPFDLTGWTIKSQARASYISGSPVVAEFTPTILTPATSGTFQLTLPASSTLTLSGSVLYYDIRIDKGVEKYFVAEGKISLSNSITRD